VADVFVSYERQDADRARLIVEALRADGLEVWWDQGLQSGARWRADIEANLAQARAVVCLWSNTSIRSEFVLDEAKDASERGVLCPALIDEVRIPLGFREIQTANLIGWSGARNDPALRHLVESVRALLSGARAPERKPPKPRTKLLPILGAVLGAAAALLTIVATSEQLGWTDLIPGFPTIGANVTPATALERSNWRAAAERTDRCEAMRQFLRQHPEGRYAAHAQTILASRTERVAQRWAPYAVPSLVTGTSNLSERASEAAACISARQSAERNAQSGCNIYAGDTTRFRGMEVALGELSCECRDHAIRINPGDEVEPIWRCNVRASYHCRGETLENTTEEYCGEPVLETAR